MQSNILPVGLIIAWLITPDSLRVINQGAGLSGLWYLLSLVIGALLAIICARLMHSPQLIKQGYKSDYAVLARVFGATIAVAIISCGRIPFLLFASTGLLVTAGFAFNEIFIHWFPNFFFASILLFTVAVLNKFSEPIVMRVQLGFTTVTVMALLILIIMGMVGGGALAEQNSSKLSGMSLDFSLFAMGFITFLGFDFCKIGDNRRTIVFTIAGGLILAAGWSIVALKFIESSRLTESYIAYMLVAKAVGGEVGRIIMGVAVIFGVLSCVNALFVVIRRVFSDLAEEHILPARASRGWIVSLLFASIIEVMMLTGFAGDEIIETQIYASILLWLLYIGIRTGVTVFLLNKFKLIKGGSGYAAGAAVLAMLGLLVFSNPQLVYIAKFLLMVLVGALVLSLICTRVYGKYSLNS